MRQHLPEAITFRLNLNFSLFQMVLNAMVLKLPTNICGKSQKIRLSNIGLLKVIKFDIVSVSISLMKSTRWDFYFKQGALKFHWQNCVDVAQQVHELW